MQDFATIIENKKNRYKRTDTVASSHMPLYTIKLPEEMAKDIPATWTNRIKKLVQLHGLEVVQSVYDYAKENAKTTTQQYFVWLTNKNNWDNTLKNALRAIERIKIVKDIVKQLPSVYKGFIYKMYGKIGKHIKSILAQSSDAKTPPATFIWQCQDYARQL
jgi:hypothetical protein